MLTRFLTKLQSKKAVSIWLVEKEAVGLLKVQQLVFKHIITARIYKFSKTD